ncbi:MAG TPA: DUF2269 family protein [Candidatus Limnocylindria bacterium]|jgi:hypothetical protein
MESLAQIMKLVHIGLAMVLVAGLVGRWLVLDAAKRTDEIGRTRSLLAASAPFERMVILSSMAILPAGFITAWAQGYPWLGLTTPWMSISLVLALGIGLLVPTVFLPRGRGFEAALDNATEAGTITPELRAAFDEPAVRAAHWAEIIAIAAIVAMMVLKPTL